MGGVADTSSSQPNSQLSLRFCAHPLHLANQFLSCLYTTHSFCTILLALLQAAGHCIPEEDEEPAPPRALRRPSAVLQGRRNEGIIMGVSAAPAAPAANGTSH